MRMAAVRLGMMLMAVLAATGAVRAASLSGASDPSIVVGFITTRTGGGAITSQDAVDGFNLALKQLGGRFSNQEVRLVTVDDKGSPDVALRQLSRLIQTERLDFIVTAVAPSSLAAMLKPLAASRLFVLNLEEGPPSLAGADCSANLFGLAPPNDADHTVLGQHLTAEGARRLVVMVPPYGLGEVAVAALKRGFPFEVTVLKPRPGAAVFPRELKRIRDIQPDAVYSLLTGGMGGAFVRAYDAAGGKDLAPLYVDADALARPFLPAMGDAALEVRTVASWSPDLEAGANRRLVSDFETEFGRPASELAARGFDAVFLLEAAIRANNGKTGDSEAMRAALRRADFASVRGPFHFNHNHQPVLNYLLLRVTRDGRGRLSQEMLEMVAKDWRAPNTASCPMHWLDEYIPPPVKPAKRG